MGMKTGLIAGIISAALLSSAHAGEVLDRIKKNGEIVAASDTGTPPANFLDENNELAGFDVDVTKEVAKRMGVKVKFVTPSWDVMTAGKWGSRWDIAISSMGPTEERAKVLDFPVIYYSIPTVLAVNSANTTITKPEDASGKRIGVQIGSTYEKYLDGTLKIDSAPPIDFKIKNANAVTYDSEGLSLDDLRLGDGTRLDAAIALSFTIDSAIEKGYPIKRVGDPLYVEPQAIAIDKGDPELAKEIKTQIDAMRADGTLKQLSEKWFKEDLTKPVDPSK